MKLIKYCLSALIATSQAINIKNMDLDVPRSSADEKAQLDDALLGVIKMPVPTDPDTIGHLNEITEDEDIKPVDELNEDYHLDIKGAGVELSNNRPYDHIGFDTGMQHQDADRVDFQIKKTSLNQKVCQNNDWAVIHYKMWSMEDGQMLEDTELSYPDRPLVYMVGHYEVSKCMEIAVQQMKIGEVAMIHCPNDLDLGGGIQNQWHTQYGFRWVHNKIDTRYKITLLDCDLNPIRFQAKSMELLKPHEPFYLISKNQDKHGKTMALAVDPVDQYHPKVTGVHNVQLKEFAGIDKPDVMQQWTYDDEEQSILSVGSKPLALFEGYNLNIVAYAYKNMPNQKFKYNIGTSRLENSMTGRAIDTNKSVIELWQNVITAEPSQSGAQKWEIKYVNDQHPADGAKDGADAKEGADAKDGEGKK